MYPENVWVDGYYDSKLSQSISFEEWRHYQQQVLDGDHHEVVVKDIDSGLVVGGILLTESLDAQVGRCLSAFHQFLLQEYRGSAKVWACALRLAREAAIERDIQFLVWTHRDEESGKFYITHKEV